MKQFVLFCLGLFLIVLINTQSQQRPPSVSLDQAMSQPANQEVPSTKQKANDNDANYAQQKAENYYSKRLNKESRVLTVGDYIAIIASSVAFLQFLALIITICVQIKNSRRQLRAYVFPENIALFDGSMMKPPEQEHVNEPGVVLLIKNSGKTPAYGVIIDACKYKDLCTPCFSPGIHEF